VTKRGEMNAKLRALTTLLSPLFASLFFACLEGGGRTLYIGVA